MTLRGEFGVKGRPFIEGFLILPQFDVRGFVSLLVDTGADTSLIAFADARRLGVPIGELPLQSEADSAMGVGGSLQCAIGHVALLFADRTGPIYLYDRPQTEISPEQRYPPVSVLGRDILDCWHMRYEPPERLEFTVRSADYTQLRDGS